MLLPTTERLTETARFDILPVAEAAALMLDGQRAALDAVGRAAQHIDGAADLLAEAVRSGNALIYAAAGSSGLMALADACELHATFGIPQEAVRIHMAGGVPVDARMPGNVEDDREGGGAAASNVGNDDAVIVLSASGTTPFALGFAERADVNGARIIAITNAPGGALLDLADVAICLETPPEIVAGSTRMAAGTAQKVALNLMSSLMGAKLGHIYQGRMVNVVADNAKLLGRSARIVAEIAGVSEGEAEVALAQTNGQTKEAILIAAGASAIAAQKLLAVHEGQLAGCFHALKNTE